MDYGDFARRFHEDQEIGRDATEDELWIFFDNGSDVGLWRVNPRTTEGEGETLGPTDAAMARHWYRGGGRELAETERRKWVDGTAVDRQGERVR